MLKLPIKRTIRKSGGSLVIYIPSETELKEKDEIKLTQVSKEKFEIEVME